jgi:hypothetical protein
MRSTRAARIIFWLGVLCLIVGLCPQYSHSRLTIHDGNEPAVDLGPFGSSGDAGTTKVTVGLPFSPLVSYVNSLDYQPLPAPKVQVNGKAADVKITNVSFNLRWSLHCELLSWSLLAVVAGIVLIVASRFLRRPVASATNPEAASPPVGCDHVGSSEG